MPLRKNTFLKEPMQRSQRVCNPNWTGIQPAQHRRVCEWNHKTDHQVLTQTFHLIKGAFSVGIIIEKKNQTIPEHISCSAGTYHLLWFILWYWREWTLTEVRVVSFLFLFRDENRRSLHRTFEKGGKLSTPAHKIENTATSFKFSFKHLGES